MSVAGASDRRSSAEQPGGLSWLLPAILLWGALSACSFVRVPIPGVNEPHYLGKAQHYWQPEWCTGDLFLDSANPHLVFYATFGWLTAVMGLPMAAVLGRLIGLAIVACGWQRMGAAILGNRWGGVLALPFFLLLHSLGNWSGEWLVGGIESKVPAYGFLFWAIGSWLSGRVLTAALTAGLAVSFHPVVGAWGVIAGVMATAATGAFIFLRDKSESEMPPPFVSTLLPTRTALTVALFLAAAAPGLAPAVGTLQSPDPRTDLSATVIQVAQRLAHHLDPMAFHKHAYVAFGMSIVIWWLLWKNTFRFSYAARWWTGFVIASLLIALVGVLVGWGPRPLANMPGWYWRVRLLKFYPFRLADLMVPVAVSLAAASTLLAVPPFRSSRLKTGLLCLAIYVAALVVPSTDQNPSRMSSARTAAWIEVCKWLRNETPPDSLIGTTDESFAIKWYAQRPEYVNYKDMPQDSATLLEWHRRWRLVREWKQASLLDGIVTPEELDQLQQETGINFLICSRFGPVDLLPVWSNRHFRIYRLATQMEESL